MSWPRSLFTLIAAILASLAFGSIAFVALPFERRGRWLKRLQRGWGRWILFGAGVRIESIEGLEHLQSDGRQLFAANHRSLLDIPVLFAAVPVAIVMPAKKELFRIPFLGWMLYAARFPRIDRSNPEAAKLALERSAKRLKGRPVSVVLFPEGTRSRDGRVAPFKKGAFFVAQDLGVPIVPLAITGTREALPKGSLRVRGGRVRVAFGPAIDVAGSSIELRDEVMSAVRLRVITALESLGEAHANERGSGSSATPLRVPG